jgi:heterodisulfide reductase subunit B
MLAMDESVAARIGINKVENALDASAEGLVTSCVFCDIQLTQVQFGDDVNTDQLPIIPITQFLGPALGIEDDALGFELNKINPEGILSKFKEVEH